MATGQAAQSPNEPPKHEIPLENDLEIKFNKWASDRQVLEEKWNSNYYSYKGLSTSPNKKDRAGFPSANDVAAGSWKKGEGVGWRSNTFVNKTRELVTSGMSLVTDQQLSEGSLQFGIGPSKLDEVLARDLPVEEARKDVTAASDMKRLIGQQLEYCHADRAFILNSLSGSLYGETYAKFGVIEVPRRTYTPFDKEADSDGVTVVHQLWKTKKQMIKSPSWDYASVWDIFRDLETDDLQEGNGIAQRVFWSRFKLNSQKDKQYYVKDAVEEVLKDNKEWDQLAVSETSLPPGVREIYNRINVFEIREFYVRVEREYAEAFEKMLKSKNKDAIMTIDPNDEFIGDEVEIMATTANGRIIRYVRLPKGEKRPWERCVWQTNLDEISGIGVADNIADLQVVLNGAFRAFEDNKKLSANVILAINSRKFKNKNLKELTPGLVLEASEYAEDIGNLVQAINIPDVGDSLLSLIATAERLIDEQGQIPRISRGIKQGGETTAFETSVQIEKAGKYIGAVLRNFDEQLVEPMITRFYEYNMDDPSVKTGKGNYIIKPLGYASLQEQVIKVAKLQQFIQMLLAVPGLAERVNLESILPNLARSFGQDADSVWKTAEQREEEAQAAQQAQAEDPNLKLQIESIMAQIAKDQSAAELNKAKAAGEMADIETGQAEVAIDRAELVHKIEIDQRAEDREAAEPPAKQRTE